MDIFTPEKRSAIMRSIKGKWTGPEKRLYEAMRDAGLSPRPHDEQLPGKPDFVFDKQRLAVCVEGCHWHACPRHYKEPKSNVAFWRAKIASNVRRDNRNRRALRAMGLSVMRVWEHEVRTARDATTIANKIHRTLCRKVK